MVVLERISHLKKNVLPLYFIILLILSVVATFKGDLRFGLSLLSVVIIISSIDSLKYSAVFKNCVIIIPLTLNILLQLFLQFNPALVEHADAKYIRVLGFDLLRFEGAFFYANAVGVFLAIAFMVSQIYKLKKTSVISVVSLILTFSYSSYFCVWWLYFFHGKSKIIKTMLILSIPLAFVAYKAIKGYDVDSNIRILTYMYYFAQIKSFSLMQWLTGGVDMHQHYWVSVSDNSYLIILYKHGVIFLTFYFLSFVMIFKKKPEILLLFLGLNFIQGLHESWIVSVYLYIFYMIADEKNKYHSDYRCKLKTKVPVLNKC